jgi:4-amino-4-deoxy-L-arabinose transferase-like glycosyltransferase
MQKVNSFALALVSLFVPGFGYFTMGNWVRGAAVLVLALTVLVLAPIYLVLILPFSALMQLNQAFLHNRDVQDSKLDDVIQRFNS